MDELHCDLLGIMEVTVHKASGIIFGDGTAKKPGNDPYVKLALMDTDPKNPRIPTKCEVNGNLLQTSARSSTKTGTEPVFEETFKLPVLADTMMLKVLLLDQDLLSTDDYLGTVEIDLMEDFFLQKTPKAVKVAYKLAADSEHVGMKVTGTLEMTVAFHHNQNTVTSVTVLDGTDVLKLHPNEVTKIKMCGWITDAQGVKSAGSASPLKQTHAVINNKAPKWNTTMYMDHNPSYDKDMIKLKVLETEQMDCFAQCCPVMCANPDPAMKAIGQVDLPVSQLVKEQTDHELGLATKEEYGPKFLKKTLKVAPIMPSGKTSGEVSVLVRYMTPAVREAVRAKKYAMLMDKKKGSNMDKDADAKAAAAKAAAAKKAAEEEAARKAAEAAAAAAAKAKKDAEENAARRAAEDEERRKREAAANAAKSRAAPTMPAKEEKKEKKKDVSIVKKAARLAMFVAGAQVVKKKFQHPRTTSDKSDSIVAGVAGAALSTLPFGPLRKP